MHALYPNHLGITMADPAAANSDDIDDVIAALIGLMGALNNPRQDDVLLREAGVSLDRSLFPLVARLGALGAMGVAQLADHAGRDHTTISRQLGVLEAAGLVERRTQTDDRRVREAALTAEGRRVDRRLAAARRRLVGLLLIDWSAEERGAFSRLARKFVAGMTRARDANRGKER
jgi:DNA-binding MarR family transcriptional regulator